MVLWGDQAPSGAHAHQHQHQQHGLQGGGQHSPLSRPQKAAATFRAGASEVLMEQAAVRFWEGHVKEHAEPHRFRGYSVEGVKGESRHIRQHWLVEWVRELKDRMPPPEFQRLQLPEHPKEEHVPVIMKALPKHEAARFEKMYTRTMAMIDAMTPALDPEYTAHHVASALTRFQAERKDYVETSYAREERERAAIAEAKPWLFAINAFNSRVEAAVKIQRAWRAFAARCKSEDEWPSDTNPHHWKHWVEFRKRHGWADEELYDKYGEPLERTDGGRKIKHKRGKLLPHASEVGTDVSARYLEQIGHVREHRAQGASGKLAGVAAAVGGKVGKAKEAYDRAMAAALRQQERANRLAEIIASQFQRVKEREERRAALCAQAAALKSAELSVAILAELERLDEEERREEAEQGDEATWLATIKELMGELQQASDSYEPAQLGGTHPTFQIDGFDLNLGSRASAIAEFKRRTRERLASKAPVPSSEPGTNWGAGTGREGYMSSDGGPGSGPGGGWSGGGGREGYLSSDGGGGLMRTRGGWGAATGRDAGYMTGEGVMSSRRWERQSTSLLGTQLGSSVGVMASAAMRDYQATISIRAHFGKNQMTDMLQKFQIAHKYKQRLLQARKKGTAAPPPPEGVSDEVWQMYRSVVKGVKARYRMELEIAQREGRPPPPPPEGITKEIAAIYEDIIANLRRLETGYDTEDAEDDKPRVRQLTAYGQAWLSAMTESSHKRKPLLRTRSAGLLGCHNLLLYRPAGTPHIQRPSWDGEAAAAAEARGLGRQTTLAPGAAAQLQRMTTLSPSPLGLANSMSSDAAAAGAFNRALDAELAAQRGGAEISGGGAAAGDPPDPPRGPLQRRFSFSQLSPANATTLQPLTARAALKLHGSVVSNPKRRTRPLVVMDTHAMEGVLWQNLAQALPPPEEEEPLLLEEVASVPALPPPIPGAAVPAPHRRRKRRSTASRPTGTDPGSRPSPRGSKRRTANGGTKSRRGSSASGGLGAYGGAARPPGPALPAALKPASYLCGDGPTKPPGTRHVSLAAVLDAPPPLRPSGAGSGGASPLTTHLQQRMQRQQSVAASAAATLHDLLRGGGSTSPLLGDAGPDSDSDLEDALFMRDDVLMEEEGEGEDEEEGEEGSQSVRRVASRASSRRASRRPSRAASRVALQGGISAAEGMMGQQEDEQTEKASPWAFLYSEHPIEEGGSLHTGGAGAKSGTVTPRSTHHTSSSHAGPGSSSSRNVDPRRLGNFFTLSEPAQSAIVVPTLMHAPLGSHTLSSLGDFSLVPGSGGATRQQSMDVEGLGTSALAAALAAAAAAAAAGEQPASGSGSPLGGGSTGHGPYSPTAPSVPPPVQLPGSVASSGPVVPTGSVLAPKPPATARHSAALSRRPPRMSLADAGTAVTRIRSVAVALAGQSKQQQGASSRAPSRSSTSSARGVGHEQQHNMTQTHYQGSTLAQLTKATMDMATAAHTAKGQAAQHKASSHATAAAGGGTATPQLPHQVSEAAAAAAAVTDGMPTKLAHIMAAQLKTALGSDTDAATPVLGRQSTPAGHTHHLSSTPPAARLLSHLEGGEVTPHWIPPAAALAASAPASRHPSRPVSRAPSVFGLAVSHALTDEDDESPARKGSGGASGLQRRRSILAPHLLEPLRSHDPAEYTAKAQEAVQALLERYDPEVQHILSQTGLTGTSPKAVLERTMDLMREPLKVQLEDMSEVVVVRARPLSAGGAKDITAVSAAGLQRRAANAMLSSQQSSSPFALPLEDAPAPPPPARGSLGGTTTFKRGPGGQSFAFNRVGGATTRTRMSSTSGGGGLGSTTISRRNTLEGSTGGGLPVSGGGALSGITFSFAGIPLVNNRGLNAGEPRQEEVDGGERGMMRRSETRVLSGSATPERQPSDAGQLSRGTSGVIPDELLSGPSLTSHSFHHVTHAICVGGLPRAPSMAGSMRSAGSVTGWWGEGGEGGIEADGSADWGLPGRVSRRRSSVTLRMRLSSATSNRAGSAGSIRPQLSAQVENLLGSGGPSGETSLASPTSLLHSRIEESEAEGRDGSGRLPVGRTPSMALSDSDRASTAGGEGSGRGSGDGSGARRLMMRGGAAAASRLSRSGKTVISDAVLEGEDEEEHESDAAEGGSGSGDRSGEGRDDGDDEGSEVYSSGSGSDSSAEWDEYFGEEGEEGEAPLTEQRAMLSFIPDLVADLFVSEQRLARASQSAAVNVLKHAAQTGATSRWRAAFGAAARLVADQQREQELELLQHFRRTQSANKRRLGLRGPEDGIINVRTMPIRHLTPEQKREMQMKYVSLFKSAKYGWLNKQLKVGLGSQGVSQANGRASTEGAEDAPGKPGGRKSSKAGEAARAARLVHARRSRAASTAVSRAASRPVSGAATPLGGESEEEEEEEEGQQVVGEGTPPLELAPGLETQAGPAEPQGPAAAAALSGWVHALLPAALHKASAGPQEGSGLDNRASGDSSGPGVQGSGGSKTGGWELGGDQLPARLSGQQVVSPRRLSGTDSDSEVYPGAPGVEASSEAVAPTRFRDLKVVGVPLAVPGELLPGHSSGGDPAATGLTPWGVGAEGTEEDQTLLRTIGLGVAGGSRRQSSISGGGGTAGYVLAPRLSQQGGAAQLLQPRLSGGPSITRKLSAPQASPPISPKPSTGGQAAPPPPGTTTTHQRSNATAPHRSRHAALATVAEQDRPTTSSSPHHPPSPTAARSAMKGSRAAREAHQGRAQVPPGGEGHPATADLSSWGWGAVPEGGVLLHDTLPGSEDAAEGGDAGDGSGERDRRVPHLHAWISDEEVSGPSPLPPPSGPSPEASHAAHLFMGLSGEVEEPPPGVTYIEAAKALSMGMPPLRASAAATSALRPSTVSGPVTAHSWDAAWAAPADDKGSGEVPGWLSRLASRMHLAQALQGGGPTPSAAGYTSARPRARLAPTLPTAAELPSMGPPADMHEAIRVSRPVKPPDLGDLCSPLIASLPGCYSRPTTVSAGGGGSSSSPHCITLYSAVSAPAVPRSLISPPLAPSPPHAQELLTPFGLRSIVPPPSRPVPPPGQGARYRSAGNTAALLALEPSGPTTQEQQQQDPQEEEGSQSVPALPVLSPRGGGSHAPPAHPVGGPALGSSALQSAPAGLYSGTSMFGSNAAATRLGLVTPAGSGVGMSAGPCMVAAFSQPASRGGAGSVLSTRAGSRYHKVEVEVEEW